MQNRQSPRINVNFFRSSQSGATVAEWPFIAIGISVLLLLGLTLSQPVYQNYQANQVITQVLNNLKPEEFASSIVYKRLDTAFVANQLPFSAQDIMQVRASPHRVFIAKKYERRLKLWGSVDIVVAFNANFEQGNNKNP